MNINEFRTLLMEFYFGKVEVKGFNDFIYTNLDIEEFVGEENYLDLISFDLNNTKDYSKSRKLVEQLYLQKFNSTIQKDYVYYVAKTLLDGNLGFFEGSKILSGLSIDYGVVDPVFCGYYDELKTNPEQLSFYKKRIIKDLQKIVTGHE